MSVLDGPAPWSTTGVGGLPYTDAPHAWNAFIAQLAARCREPVR